jgi:hypothetical protein
VLERRRLPDRRRGDRRRSGRTPQQSLEAAATAAPPHSTPAPAQIAAPAPPASLSHGEHVGGAPPAPPGPVDVDRLGRFASSVANDFNDLLTAILGYGDLVHATLADQNPARAGVESIQAAASRAAALARQLLALSPRQSAALDLVDVNQVVLAAAPLLERACGPGVQLTLRLGPETPPVRFSDALLERVVVAMALDARDASPHSPSVVVRSLGVSLERDRRDAGDAAPSTGQYAVLLLSDREPTDVHAEAAAAVGARWSASAWRPAPGLETLAGVIAQAGGDVRMLRTTEGPSGCCSSCRRRRSRPTRRRVRPARRSWWSRTRRRYAR